MNQQTNQPVRDHDARRGKRTAPATPPEYRTLTPDEMKQIDALLGRTGPTLIRGADAPPEKPESAGRLLQTVVVAIILLSIVAAALYLFR
jgi:hypothetical protein